MTPGWYFLLIHFSHVFVAGEEQGQRAKTNMGAGNRLILHGDNLLGRLVLVQQLYDSTNILY